jgi:D-alanyl-D-alanine carboxypeptidase/D-alanyl-D-alanine-endopeptidase (penicillin-binding protein 4)
VADYPQPAALAALAASAARALRAAHVSQVRVGYDTSLFSGPGMAPGWSPSYVSTGDVTPVTALEVDQGRLTASGRPEDADDPGNYRPRSADSAADAAGYFASSLAAWGIHVQGAPRQERAVPRAAELARVHSPPLADILEWMLIESNNDIAEALARQVAIATGRPASFSGGAAAVRATLRGLGASAGIRTVDGSGLSPEDRITPMALARLISMAAAPRYPRLRVIITGLPVAGFSGTLSAAENRFVTKLSAPAAGTVRAKTGTLDNVRALAGLVVDKDGRLLAFAFMINRVPAKTMTASAVILDRLAAALAGCGCR